MKILGISCFYHDSAASIIIDNEIIAAAQEERFIREKNTPKFPLNAIKFCLEETGCKINELDAIVFYDKPIIKFERLLSNFYAIAPKGLIPFLKYIPVWVKEKLFLKKILLENLRKIEPTLSKKKNNFFFTEHHLSHASSAFYPSNFKESAILTIDGVGEWCTASIAHGNDKKIKIIKELHYPHSVGLLYSAFTYYLGFKVNSGEYKLMGLAPYGNNRSKQTLEFIYKIKSFIVDIKSDGSIFLNQEYFNFTNSLKMIKEKKFLNLFGLKKRNNNDSIEQIHCNMAFAIQKITEDIVIKMFKETKKITNSNNICFAGGVALNCVINGKIKDLDIFKNIYIQPASGDSGGSLGCALAINHMFFKKERVFSKNYDLMKGAYLGPYFSDKEIMIMNNKNKASYKFYDSFDDLSKYISKLISQGNIIGWFQGRSEFGPRALGNRSILADPTNLKMQKKLNLKIKYRENFRPFAPSVLKEDYEKYFEGKKSDPYMLFVKKIKKEIRFKLPKNYHNLDYNNKLYTRRSILQAITHVDFSSRIHLVSKSTNFKFWSLINNFKKITGLGVLVNTSFNIRKEPIVNNPNDAFECFMKTEMDYLVIENYIYCKKKQKV